MTFFQLYKLVRQNQNLAQKRHPMLERNKSMKVFAWIMIAFWAGYLIIFAFLFGSICSSKPTYNPINGGIICFLILDFYIRFIMQETPAHEIKAYKLLPIKESRLITIFLTRIGTSAYNLFWLCFFVPFGIITIMFAPNYGTCHFLAYILFIWLLMVMNAYWYLFWRSLCNHNMLWHLVPFAIYAALVTFGLVLDTWLYEFCKHLVHDAVCWSALPFYAVIAAIALLFIINSHFQRRFIYFEIAKVERIKKVKSREYSFLNRFGEVGEYLKLEIKSIQRNKTVKKQFFSGLFATIMLCALFAFTDAYDDAFMQVFVCMYCFACLGVITLTNIMCAEGNYIDCLMSRKESILSLLKAKYYFNCLMTILPLLIFLMPICMGKTPVIEALACLFFAAGVIFPFLFQLAVYNNISMPLNEVLTRSGQNNKTQIICSLTALFVPMIIMYLALNFCGKTAGSLIILVIGVAGVATHPYWLRNVYKRFMIRRYENMSNFRATRRG